MTKKLVKQVIAFESNGGSLHASYAEAALDGAQTSIYDILSDETGDKRDGISQEQYDLDVYALALLLAQHKQAFRAILRDL